MSRQKLLRRLIALLLLFFSTTLCAAQLASFKEGVLEEEAPGRWCFSAGGGWAPYSEDASKKLDWAIQFHNLLLARGRADYQADFEEAKLPAAFDKEKIKKLKEAFPLGKAAVSIFIKVLKNGVLSSREGYHFVNTTGQVTVIKRFLLSELDPNP